MDTTTATCPSCNAALSGTPRCTNCHLLLVGPTARRLWEVDRTLGQLSAERPHLLEQLKYESWQTAPVMNPATNGTMTGTSSFGQHPQPPYQTAAQPATPQTSTPHGPAGPWQQPWQAPAAPQETAKSYTGQQILLGLGGILVVLGAIVFAAVAWQRIGEWGQLLLVGMLTLGLAGSSIAASEKKLRQSAEALAGAACGLLGVSMIAAHGLGLVTTSLPNWLLVTSLTVTAATGTLWATRREIRAYGIASTLAAQTIIPAILNATSTPLEWWAVALVAAGSAGAYLGHQLKGIIGAVSLTAGGTITAVFASIGVLQTYLAPVSGHHPYTGAAAGILGAAAFAAAALIVRGDTEKNLLGITSGILAALTIHATTQAYHTERLQTAAGIVAVLVAGWALQMRTWQERSALTGAALLGGITLVSGDAANASLILLAGSAAAGWNSWKRHQRGTAAASSIMLHLGAYLGGTALEIPQQQLLIGVVALAAATSILGWALGKDRNLEVGSVAAGAALLGYVAAHTESAGTVATILWIVSGTVAAHAAHKTLPHLDLAAAATATAAGGYTLVEYGANTATTSGTMLGVAAAALLTSWKTRKELPYEILAGTAALYAIGQAATSPVVLAWTLWGTAALILLDAVRQGRGWLGPVGVTAAAIGNTVLLAHGHITIVEAYTLPLAAGLLAVGMVHEYRRRQEGARAPSWLTVGPAASAALLPSALVALDSGGMRAPLVLLAAAAMLIVGLVSRLQALLLIPGAVTLVLGWHLLAPIAADLPRWAVLLLAGLALLAVGASYEARLNDLKRAGRWVQTLR